MSRENEDTSKYATASTAIDTLEYIPIKSSKMSRSGVNLDPTLEKIITDPIAPTRANNMVLTASTHMGKRKNQEDRFVVAPFLLSGELMFFGVFDGTVQEHAAEYVKNNIINIMYGTEAFRQFADLTAEERADRANRKQFIHVIAQTYRETDRMLLEFCRAHEYHYSSCTSITIFFHLPSQTLYVAHLADSHAILATPAPVHPNSEVTDPSNQPLIGQYLTRPHRPDNPDELRRIQSCGGSLVYLHTNKPFIRGGDFHQRKLAMQLNYSRAFGGKDLKPYGLSSVPDIRVIDAKLPAGCNPLNTAPSTLTGEDVRMIVLGSDGLWDVVAPNDAVTVAQRSLQYYINSQEKKKGKEEDKDGNDAPIPTPAEVLVDYALKNHVIKGSSDNVTAIAIFL